MYCYVGDIPFREEQLWSRKESLLRQDGMPRDATPAVPEGAPVDKLIHLALPVRLVHMRNGSRNGIELACTYDIHPRGARLLSRS